MNTHKHTLRIRLASLALVAFDAWLLVNFPSLVTAFLIWIPVSMALILATCPCPSRFREGGIR